jgi:histone arginine demethylase JMJD6
VEPQVDNIERVNINEITVEQFIEKYEKGSRPCIITGVADTWPAQKAWCVNSLIERFGSSMFKCGESDGGRKLKVTLKEYIEYAIYNRDDSPLYMFESSLEEHPEAKVMMNDY